VVGATVVAGVVDVVAVGATVAGAVAGVDVLVG
jgi:hypothetical protein